ncbi:MAG: hypothetical protein IPL61_39025 [Myxococcales bacterium]|nr:hypothetical protein [Myxococcales bacterium]
MAIDHELHALASTCTCTPAIVTPMAATFQGFGGLAGYSVQPGIVGARAMIARVATSAGNAPRGVSAK